MSESKTFITDLNHLKVDVIDGSIPEHIVYFNARIHWGIILHENSRYIDISPFVDRVEVFCGEDSRSSDGMLIIKEDFLDIKNDYSEDQEWEVKFCYLRDNDCPSYQHRITIIPKFVGIDQRKKIVEVLFNA